MVRSARQDTVSRPRGWAQAGGLGGGSGADHDNRRVVRCHHRFDLVLGGGATSRGRRDSKVIDPDHRPFPAGLRGIDQVNQLGFLAQATVEPGEGREVGGASRTLRYVHALAVDDDITHARRPILVERTWKA